VNSAARTTRSEAPRSGSAKRQRTRFVNVRLTPDEHAAMEAAAERAGQSVASYVRQQCIGTPGPRAVPRPPVERAALAQLLAQLGKCGSNLNQIARVLNSGGDEPDGIPDAIADFRATCGDIMRALGRSFGETSGRSAGKGAA
jgi:hypothetical protein